MAPLDFGAPAPTSTLGPPRRIQSANPLMMILHAIPAALLVFCLFLVLCWDVASRLMGGTEKPKGPPSFVETGTGGTDKRDVDRPLCTNTDPLIGVAFDTATPHRFGMVMLKERDPMDPDRKKRLTRDENGHSNNTCILIDGSGHLFGLEPGKGAKIAKQPYKNRSAWESVWDYTADKIKVRQYVEIVPGEQSQRLDTVLVWYTIENYGTVEKTVGLRMMLDTFIGANDGVPFVIPGQKGLLTDYRDFGEKDIPDYVEAIEIPDPNKPGTVAHLGLKGIELPGAQVEPVHSMLICRWISSEMRWRPEKKDIRSIEGQDGEAGDSCVYLYWLDRPMPKGEKRHMAFTYGLGKMAAAPPDGSGPGPGMGKTGLGLTSGGKFAPGGVFTVTAYVKGAKDGQTVKLDVPSGLALMPDETAEKTIGAADPKAGYSQVSWRVKAKDTGEFELKATSAGLTAKDKVKIKIGGVFGSD
jgi:hypothetical protein